MSDGDILRETRCLPNSRFANIISVASNPGFRVNYSRLNPSPRYRELQALYARMHVEGEHNLNLPPERTFPGQSLFAHIERIKRVIDATGARTILDYGAGKGLQYRPQRIVVGGAHVADGIAEYWDVDDVHCYDPGYAPFSRLPAGRFDGVISTDVLEHCAEEDLGWIIDELFGYARRFVYVNVACFPARKRLPNGENAHATVREPGWWRDLFAARARRFPGIAWELHAAVQTADGVYEKAFRREDGGAENAPPDVPRGEVVIEVGLEGRIARFAAPSETAVWRAQTLYTKEPVTIDWLRAIPAGAVFLDVGANVGMYTVFAALARDAQVFAFEPESQNYALLNRNLALNELGGRVVAYCAALSDVATLDRLYLSELGAGGSCHSFGAEVGFDLQPRPAAFAQGCVSFRFDELVARGLLPVPGYVKIDVDGFEHKVLCGMTETLRDPAVRSLLVELNPHIAEHLASRKALEALGFAWDPRQAEAAARRNGPFEGVSEHVFRR